MSFILSNYQLFQHYSLLTFEKQGKFFSKKKFALILCFLKLFEIQSFVDSLILGFGLNWLFIFYFISKNNNSLILFCIDLINNLKDVGF